MNVFSKIRLPLMMLIQYIVWGVWYSTLGAYMSEKGFSASQIPLAYSSTAIASMISPLFVGIIADRFFFFFKVMARLHFLAAIFAVLVVTQDSFLPFFCFLLLHTICYMPTLALANSISLRNLEKPAEQFPLIRVFGSFGWIAAGFIISGLMFDKSAGMFYTAAAFGVFMSFYCLTLPHTPPLKTGKKPTVREIIGLDALSLLKDKNVTVFMLGSFLTCIPLTFYFNETGIYLADSGIEKIAMTMTVGQWIEAGFFLIMPLMLRGLGIKKVLLLGMLCWAIRLFCFGFASGTTGSLLWLIILGITLHGMSYDFFFVSGQIYIDRRAPKELRSSAQGLLYSLTLGAGMLVGSLVVSWVNVQNTYQGYLPDNTQPVVVYNWPYIWYIASAMAVFVFILFAFAFEDTDAKDAAEMKLRSANFTKAWGAIGGILITMLVISFAFHFFLLKGATCAGLWGDLEKQVKIQISTSEVTTDSGKRQVVGNFLLTQTLKDKEKIYHLAKISDVMGGVDENIPGKHQVEFEASVVKLVENGTNRIPMTEVLKTGRGILVWSQSKTDGDKITYEFIDGENNSEKYILSRQKKVYHKE